MKVLLIGDYPPPYGGVAVQVSALRRRLSEIPGSTCQILDIGASRRQRRPGCLAVRNPADFVGKIATHALRGYTIHLHTNGHNLKSWQITFLCGMAGMANGRRTVVSIGSGMAPDFIEQAGGFTRALIRVALGLFGAVICRNERARCAMLHIGIPADRISILEGFYGVRAEDLGPVPPAIERFLQDHSPVVGAMASVGPEYGIPLLTQAASNLHSRYPLLGLVLIGPAMPERDGFQGGLLVTGSLPNSAVLGIMQKLDVFVRPTYFDGDASSVREALALRVPVVASDTDFRPHGVILFRRGDSIELTRKIAFALEQERTPDPQLSPTPSKSWERLLVIYERLGAHA